MWTLKAYFICACKCAYMHALLFHFLLLNLFEVLCIPASGSFVKSFIDYYCFGCIVVLHALVV